MVSKVVPCMTGEGLEKLKLAILKDHFKVSRSVDGCNEWSGSHEEEGWKNKMSLVEIKTKMLK